MAFAQINSIEPAAFVLLSFDLCTYDESAVAAGFPCCCCDITTALSGPVTLATGTHCTASVPSFIYLFTLKPVIDMLTVISHPTGENEC